MCLNGFPRIVLSISIITISILIILTISSSSSISFTEHLDLIPAYFSDFCFLPLSLISLSFKHGTFFLRPLKYLYLDHSFLPGYLPALPLSFSTHVACPEKSSPT